MLRGLACAAAGAVREGRGGPGRCGGLWTRPLRGGGNWRPGSGCCGSWGALIANGTMGAGGKMGGVRRVGGVMVRVPTPASNDRGYLPAVADISLRISYQ